MKSAAKKTTGQTPMSDESGKDEIGTDETATDETGVRPGVTESAAEGGMVTDEAVMVPAAEPESPGELTVTFGAVDGGPGEPEARAEPEAEAALAPGGTPSERTSGRRAEDAPEDAAEPAPVPVREMPLPEPASRALTSALSELRESISGLRFGLDLPGAEEARKEQDEILAQLGGYVIPRVHVNTAPALIVVAGSTGAGKSTLVNSLAAAKVSATGVRRPTTGTPVLACHPSDHDWFARGPILGHLRRSEAGHGLPGDAGTLIIAATERLPSGVALLDTPDIDSVVEEHHEIAHRMLDAGDLWVFVTTAARYADAPSWQLLKLAKERGARLAIVLSRVPPRSRDVILKHFVRMLEDYGLGEVERFVIHEAEVTSGRLPEQEIAELRRWLAELSVDGQRRAQAVRSTLAGVLDSFRGRVPALARQLEAQVAFRAELRTDVDAAYMGALAEIDTATRDGSLLRGEVLARWQDFAGSGDLQHAMHRRRPSLFGGKARQQAPIRLRALKSALRTGLESIIAVAAQRAAEEVVGRWRNRAGAGDRLAASADLSRPSEELMRRTSRAIGAWQEHLVELIRADGATKRSIARLMSFDVESMAVVLAVGLLGYEVTDGAQSSLAAGSLPERLLRGLLGTETLRGISAKARSDLRARIGMLFDEETLRYVQVLDSAGIPDEAAATRLYQATYNLEVAR